MSSSTRWISRGLVAAGAGGLLVLGTAFGAGGAGAAPADDTPSTTAPAGRPGTLPPEPPTTASPQTPTRAERGRPGTLPAAASAPARPVRGVPSYTG